MVSRRDGNSCLGIRKKWQLENGHLFTSCCHTDDADSCRIAAHAVGDSQPCSTLHRTDCPMTFPWALDSYSVTNLQRDRGRTLLALLKTVAGKNSAPDVKLTYRNWFGRTANVGGTSGGRMERRGRRRVTDMLGTGVTSDDRGALAVWRRRATG